MRKDFITKGFTGALQAQKDHDRRRVNILERSFYQISSSGEEVIFLTFGYLPAKPLENLEHILPDLPLFG